MKDLTGFVINNLEVLYRIEDYVSPKGVHKSRWHCKCHCGKEFDAIGDNLRSGNTKSCGCTQNNLDALVGQKINDWYVIKEVSKISGQRRFLCRCKCGTTKEIFGTHLIRGKSKSCRKCREHSYQDLTNEIFGYLQVVSENKEKYSSKTHYWNCRCLLCGYMTVASTNSLHSNNKTSCGCLKSKGEQTIIEILCKEHIDYKKEYVFDNLKSKHDQYLRFDFALFNNQTLKCLIEFQGEQHYRNTFGIPQDEWNENIERDNQKKEFCKENNIVLYIIKFDEDVRGKMEEIINEIKRAC